MRLHQFASLACSDFIRKSATAHFSLSHAQFTFSVDCQQAWEFNLLWISVRNIDFSAVHHKLYSFLF